MAIKKLKYQEKAFEELKEYLASLKSFDGNPRKAFIDVVKRDSVSYHDTFGDIPYVCMKLPTGAGKTFVACNCIGGIMDNYLQNKLYKGIVLWITPTDEIQSQTSRKLKDSRDFHRQSLNESFDNNVLIFSNGE